MLSSTIGWNLATIESKFEFTSGNKTAGLIAFIFFLASSGETGFFVPAASFMEESLSEGRQNARWAVVKDCSEGEKLCNV